ncbi:hypothetical protein [Nocardioides ferulae]|uniref:hypothetical protein n=1 Tax=Nocardioides ferulae TaxID=2340821 RepID=UPI000EB535BD|nr:hypothetical protein [Nocardioides ferulae]
MSKRAEVIAAVRRSLPAATVPLRARAGARLAARDPRVRERARRSMALLLDQVRPDADLDALAERYLAYQAWQNEARWHHSLCGPLHVAGLDRLHAIPGGVVVSFLHHGPFLTIGSSLGRSGRDIQAIATPGLCGGRQAPWERQTQAVAERDCHLFPVTEGSAGIRSRLEQGSVVAVALDVPGRTPVTFLGKQLIGSSGATRAAYATGCPVVNATMHRAADGTPFYRLDEPLHPASFESPEAMLGELLRRQEESVLAWPEAYYDPLTKWRLAEDLAAEHADDRG